jgi:hypothetical protein
MSSAVHEWIPEAQRNQLVSMVGAGPATVVLEEIAYSLEQRKPIAAPPLDLRRTRSGYADGDRFGILQMSNGRSYRPDDSLSYTTIDDMLTNGHVLFALNMKLAGIRSVLRDDRSWVVRCEDKRISQTIRGIMNWVFRRYAKEMLLSMAYGASFFEKVWTYKPASYWGIEGTRGKVYGYDALLSCHPRSIAHINYTDDGQHFDGFTQSPSGIVAGPGTTPVPAETALVITYDKRWRNLWGNPGFDPVYPLWFWLEVTLRSFLRYLERTGTPVTVCYAPGHGNTMAPDGTLYANLKYAQLVAGYVAKSNAIAIPSDVDPDTKQQLWRLEYLADDKRGDQFVRAIEVLGTLIARAMILADRATMQGSEVGSYAASETHMAATVTHNELVLDELLIQVNDYLVEPIRRYNGTQRTPRAWIETATMDPEARERLFKLLSTMGNQQGSDAMKQVDWAAIMEVMRVPVKSPEEIEQDFQDELKHTEERNKMLAKSAEQGAGAPFPKKGQGPEAEAKQKQATAEKVKQSADWALYQVSSGATVPLMVTGAQALEIADRFSENPSYFFSRTTDGFDAQVERIVEQIMSEVEGVETASPEDIQRLRELILREIGLSDSSAKLEYDDLDYDAIELALGAWLKEAWKKVKQIASKVVKAVTGRTPQEWKKTRETGSRGGVTVTRADGTTYTWRSEDHPRDASGKFAKKAAADSEGGEADEKGLVEDIPDLSGPEHPPKPPPLTSLFSEDRWETPSEFPDIENASEVRTITVDGLSYAAIGEIDPELFASIHETRAGMAEKSEGLYDGLEPVHLTILNMEDTASMASALGVSEDDVRSYVEETGGQMAVFGMMGGITIDDKLARESKEMFEVVLYHETLHGQSRENGSVMATFTYDPDEIWTTLLTMEYAQKHGLPEVNGYPTWTSWAVQAADNLGWSKQKLFDYAERAHRLGGTDSKELVGALLEQADVSGGTSETRDRRYKESLKEMFPEWENDTKALASVYGIDVDDFVSSLWGE